METLAACIKVGDSITKFNETFTWTLEHIDGQKLEELRLEGDSLADEALPFLRSGDAINSILESTNPAVQALRDQVTSVPSWVNYDQIKRGQTFFWKYHPLCMIILLNASLVGGFGAKRVTSTLQCTNYLANKETAWKRMVETALMVQDVMSFGGLEVGAKGWSSTLKVRMMHAQVRRHVLRQSKYDADANGIPVNQEDLLSTMAVFSTRIVYSLRDLGVPVLEQEAEDYIATWRYIGYLMGIQHLPHFKSYQSSLVLKESVMVHLLDPDESCAQLANNVIDACENKPPLFISKNSSAALTRRLLGHEWADQLQLPRSKFYSAWIEIYLALMIGSVKLTNYFIQPLAIQFSQKASYALLHSQLGNRRPTYNFDRFAAAKSLGPQAIRSENYLFVILVLLVLGTFARIALSLLQHLLS